MNIFYSPFLKQPDTSFYKAYSKTYTQDKKVQTN